VAGIGGFVFIMVIILTIICCVRGRKDVSYQAKEIGFL